MSLARWLRHPRLSRQLIVWFLLISLVPLAHAIGVIYLQSEESLEQGVIDDLRSVAQRQGQQILRYLRGQERNVTTLAHAPDIAVAMRGFSATFDSGGLDCPAYAKLERRLRGYLTYYQESYGYDDLYLIAPDGRVVFSVDRGEDLGTDLKNGLYRRTELAKAFDRAITMLETGISDFDYYPVTNEPAAFIASAILHKGMIIGVVALRLNNDEIYHIINDYIGLGKTGETVVASRIGDKAVLQAPTRFDPFAAFRKKVSLNGRGGQGVVRAVRGQKGHGLIKDYRGQRCLAVWRYLPDMRWGMVTKIDAAEAFAPVTHLRQVLILISVITIVLVVLAAVLVARSISDPIRRLTHLTRQVSAGDLEQKVQVRSRNEIGELAESFNQMTVQLKDSMEQLRVTTAAKERIESELDIARDIQMSMVPKLFPPFPEREEMDIFATIQPARQVGGDLYDFFFLDENRFCFLIGDVSGKGVPASLFMAVAKTLLKANATGGDQPSRILERANHELCQGNDACMFVTLFLAILDLAEGRLEYGNGGHNPPVLLRPGTAPEMMAVDKNMALGVMEGMTYTSGSIDFRPGDAIFLYTDGVTEAVGPGDELFGEPRLLDALADAGETGCSETIAAVTRQVEQFSAGLPQADDITMVMLRLRSLAG